VAYQVIVLPAAEADLERIDESIRGGLLRRLLWLAANAAQVIHHRLANMPEDLAGLCRLRAGDYRILYWVYPDRRLLKIYRVQHRREVYRER
jgi:mRNA-degrading endonuclease RelE of RelBE toxin-antitoxin system